MCFENIVKCSKKNLNTLTIVIDMQVRYYATRSHYYLGIGSIVDLSKCANMFLIKLTLNLKYVK
jgi:hypothetical protein